MESTADIFQTFVMASCIIGLALMVICCICIILVSTMRRQIEMAKKTKRTSVAVALLFAAVCVIYGGGKSGPRFFFNGLSIIENANYATNDLVHIEWGYNPDFPGIEEDNVFVAYEPIDDYTNNVSSWVEHPETWKVYERGCEFALADATNYVYMVWTEYIPPFPVVTNGVYHLSGFDRVDDGTNKYVSLRVNIRITGTNGVEHSIAPINERNE